MDDNDQEEDITTRAIRMSGLEVDSAGGCLSRQTLTYSSGELVALRMR